MYTASVQTTFFLDKFSMVEELRMTNCSELPVIPVVNKPNRAPLKSLSAGSVSQGGATPLTSTMLRASERQLYESAKSRGSACSSAEVESSIANKFLLAQSKNAPSILGDASWPSI